MAHHDSTRPGKLIQITPLPQIVPSPVCLACDVCCRFPESDSFLRPYFTAEEVSQAVAHGLDTRHFPDRQGGQVMLVPNPSGEGYLCPAFDPVSAHCRIYEVRPLDCQIYPLALMWSSDATEVMLGWDTKCPFLRTGTEHEARGDGLGEGAGHEAKGKVRGTGREARGDRRGEGDSQENREDSGPLPRASRLAPAAYAEEIVARIERADTVEMLARNPRLIGRYQDDVVIVQSLPVLTERLRRSHLALRPLKLEDRAQLERGAAASETTLAAFAYPPHAIWRDLLAYSWAQVGDHWCLFAEYPDGLYMPLPPLGSGSLSKSLVQAFVLMRERNRGSMVSRVENVPEELKAECEALGYRLSPKDSDYLYQASDLASLAGDRYKSQRAACNKASRTHRMHYAPYRNDDHEGCLTLYRTWAEQHHARGLDVVARHMLQDAESAHRQALTHHEALGLVGRVVRVDGAVRAYTFGYARSTSVFVVLLEIADRSVTGLAQWTFRECCREAAEQGYRFINTMDDSGLESLRRSKQAYHPFRIIVSYIATEFDTPS